MYIQDDDCTPELYNADGKRYELNYHELCLLLVNKLQLDPYIDSKTKAKLMTKIAKMHDTLIDMSW